MKLYHGSTVIVDKPLVSFGRDNLDFGKGFLAGKISCFVTFSAENLDEIAFSALRHFDICFLSAMQQKVRLFLLIRIFFSCYLPARS